MSALTAMLADAAVFLPGLTQAVHSWLSARHGFQHVHLPAQAQNPIQTQTPATQAPHKQSATAGAQHASAASARPQVPDNAVTKTSSTQAQPVQVRCTVPVQVHSMYGKAHAMDIVVSLIACAHLGHSAFVVVGHAVGATHGLVLLGADGDLLALYGPLLGV